MKHVLNTLRMVIILALFPSVLSAQTLTVDTEASSLRWTGYHLAKSYEHTGNISIKEGSVEVEDGKLTGGSFTVDMTTLTNMDLENKKDNAKLVKDLKSKRFFHASSFPTTTLTITNVSSTEQNKYTVTADLTIKGVTKEIQFDTKQSTNGDSLILEANLSVDRTKYDIVTMWSVENAILSNIFDMEVKIIAR